jgi:hypothetical protein
MDNIYLYSGIVSFIFFLCKFFEMKYIEKEIKPLKLLLRDTLLVYISIIIGYYIIQQLTPVINDGKITPPVIVDNPDF